MKLARKIATLTVTCGLAIGSFALAAPVSAHGYLDGPKSRALLCKEGANLNCGSVVYEPQSLEYLKGFPQSGPADGKIASANGQFGGLLDQQTSARWAKTDITSGPLLMDWTYTAPHSTQGWSYYMTKPGWDQNAPLTRSGLEKIATVDHDGSKAFTNPDHVINIPSNRNGYHVILAVWDIADTVNAFYNVIDVNVNGAGEEVVAPNAPSNLTALENAAGGVELTWADSNSDRSDVTYTVARDGVQVGKSSGTSFTDLEVVPGATYQYSVTASDAQGSQSTQSATVNVTLAQNVDADVTAPTVPSNLHTMQVTATEVNLMWGESFDAAGAVTYNVYRDGYLRHTTELTMWKDTSVVAGTTYQYVVKAIDSSNNESVSSNVLNASTPAAPAPAPAPESGGNWNSFAAYQTGDIVTFNGTTYRAVQSYQGAGDDRWIDAPSLWVPVVEAAPESGGDWNSSAAYQTGDIVTFNGTTYRAVQSYQGAGDDRWIDALALWTPVADVAPEPEVTPAPVPALAEQWSATGSYQTGDRVVSNGVTYEAVQSYQGAGDPRWIDALSLWKKV